MSIIQKSLKYSIYLASQSPRRIELLKWLGINFNIASKLNVSEEYPSSLNGSEIAIYISEKKSDAYSEIIKDNRLVITADTIVLCEQKVLGKPTDKKNAIEMLKQLSNKKHIVTTAVTLRTINKKLTFFEETEVKFKQLLEEEINYYVDNYNVYDKAGSYGIQDWIGLIGIEKINGCFFNVMGFPTQRFTNEFIKFSDLPL